MCQPKTRRRTTRSCGPWQSTTRKRGLSSGPRVSRSSGKVRRDDGRPSQAGVVTVRRNCSQCDVIMPYQNNVLIERKDWIGNVKNIFCESGFILFGYNKKELP